MLQDDTLDRIFAASARADVTLPPTYMQAVQQAAAAAAAEAAPRWRMARLRRVSAFGGLAAAAVCGLWIGTALPQMIGAGQASAAIAVPLYQDLDVYALLEE
ncbi:hypothetical protein BVG79_00807 [Ketogulonicigenium robustum]|uniref:Uncharacterized protein n=2 Tax=Ketogulonicigenium robustum TaxID=92947 RepID=A0A1W6NY97_9RHOB|nr:hypothetical protein BVG79_00807 [Ketogulonicigenium robustum]